MAACVALLVCNLALTACADDARPNIIVIFTDDQGFSDLGCQGFRGDIRTPHIDGLARRGVRMTHGFVTAPQCMPSRVGILTGRYQQHSGVETNLTATQPSRVAAMAPGVETIASQLQRAGYTTGMSGKWGVGGGPTRAMQKEDKFVLPRRDLPFLPSARGFDEYVSGTSQVYVVSHGLDGSPVADPPQLLTDDRYRVEVQADAALGFIKRHARDESPFFLYYTPYSPHAPFEAPESYLAQFQHVQDKKRRVCLAMMACVDDSVGRIVNELRTAEIEDNTLIWFISDNGAPKNGGGFNAPLGGSKGSLRDGGVRVPFLVTWPDRLPAGTEYDPMVSTLDVMPTCLTAAGVNQHPVGLHGVNLLPFIAGDESSVPHQHLYFRWSFRGAEQAAVRSAGWKLIRSGSQRRLFDLRNDVAEETNVVSDHPHVADDLETLLEDWLTTLPPPATSPRAKSRSNKR
ncbi:MAG: sulfatase-like hydrolase/transferase [Planctomycetota bacterium]